MKRFLVALICMLSLFGLATPAQAIHKGQVCKSFQGPDGLGGAHLGVCLVVDDHDFKDQIRAMVLFYNVGTRRADVHVSYLKLVRYTTTVRNTGPFVRSIFPDDPRAFTTTWFLHPQGLFHSRIRMWVCWPNRTGDHCGNVVVWNTERVASI